MSDRDVVTSWMHELVRQMLGKDEPVVVEPNGSVGVHAGSTGYVVDVVGTKDPHIRVLCATVLEVGLDPGLLEALNDLNTRLCHANVHWEAERVWLQGQLVGRTAELEDLTCLVEEVVTTARREGPRLARTFGGHVRFPDKVDEEDAA